MFDEFQEFFKNLIMTQSLLPCPLWRRPCLCTPNYLVVLTHNNQLYRTKLELVRITMINHINQLKTLSTETVIFFFCRTRASIHPLRNNTHFSRVVLRADNLRPSTSYIPFPLQFITQRIEIFPWCPRPLATVHSAHFH